MLFKVNSSDTLGKYLTQAGKYNVRITDAEAGQSYQGNPKVTINYEVLDGEFAGCPIRFDTLTWIDSDPEQLRHSVTRFNDLLVKIGVEDGTTVDTIQDYANGLRNRQLAVVVAWEKSEYGDNAGKYFLRVKSHEKLDPEGSKPNGVKRPDLAGKQGSDQPKEAQSQGNQDNVTDLPF